MAEFRTSDGVVLNIQDTGGGVTVLLVHGWTSDSRVWSPLVNALAGEVRLLRYDQRGHGRSERGPATLPRLADDLAEVIAKSTTGPIVLVGHSMGGMVMMALAECHPDLVTDRIAAAMFVATSSGRMDEATFGLPKPLVRAYFNRSGRGSGHSRPSAPSRIQAFAGLVFLRWLAFGHRFRLVDLRSAGDQLARAHRGTTGALRREITGNHARGPALAVYAKIPTEVLVGDRDRVIPPTHAAEIARLLPGTEFVRYPGAGHMLPYERTAELARRVLRLASGVRRGGGGPGLGPLPPAAGAHG
ncbi:alpha/beta fold hydrolase [Actinokineospora inagensis]|uniref:alpha/beta fold hydrolase n=1 Tax=Actinokineospora inagensis TaxID=103730 RepID=UPI000408C38E|nr:alpha/beta hydrolase [Actinokineospora inagensis]